MMTFVPRPTDLADAIDAATKPHAIIIGSGFGGLAAAIRLGAKGYRVTVIERLEQAGGRASVFRQDGFTFDAGPTIVTAPFVFEELWALCGRNFAEDVDLRKMDPFYKIHFDDGRTFTVTDDPERMRAEIAKFNPDDLAGYERYLKDSKACYYVGFEGLGLIPFSKIRTMLAALPRLGYLRADRSVFGHAKKHIKDAQVRVALSFHPLFIGGNPLRVTSVYCLIAYLEREWGVHFTMGGTGALVQAMVDLMQDQGATLRLNQEVSEILVEDGRACGVELASGHRLYADIVVSNADPALTYGKLLPKKHIKRWSRKKIAKAHYSMSLFVWYFGTKKRYDAIEHHSLILGPRYEELLTDIFENKVLAEDFSLYLHRPTKTDPSLAPEGCDAFYVLSPVPHLASGTDWETAAEPYRQAIEKRLEETIMPGLSSEIISSKMITPIDFRDRLQSYHGAAFGMEPRITQSAWFRPHNRSEEVANLYMVGAGTHPGAGLPGVVTSAKIVAEMIPDAAILNRKN
ncbi:MAG: phytoene desaturase [Rhizobiales bacterium]|nr:phytoene desaturase [Hyphomicrobiales bacterium]